MMDTRYQYQIINCTMYEEKLPLLLNQIILESNAIIIIIYNVTQLTYLKQTFKVRRTTFTITRWFIIDSSSSRRSFEITIQCTIIKRKLHKTDLFTKYFNYYLMIKDWYFCLHCSLYSDTNRDFNESITTGLIMH